MAKKRFFGGKSGVLLLVFAISFLLLGSSVFAETVVVGNFIIGDTTWYAGNTYFIRGNPAVSNVTLTIQPGAVIKFSRPTSRLSVASGGRLVAKGTSTNMIHFTSCKDQTIGADLSGYPECEGSPQAGDYLCAIEYKGGAAAPTADANDLADLNISFAAGGIHIYTRYDIGISLNSIHDSNFQNIGYGGGLFIDGDCRESAIAKVFNNTFTNIKTGGDYTDGAAIYVGCAEITHIFNNTFVNNEASTTYGRGGAIYLDSGAKVSDVHDNVFINNRAANGGAIHNDGELGSLFSNTFINNAARTDGSGGALNGGFRNLYNNVFINNTAAYGGAIYSYATNLYDNKFEKNSAGWGGGAIYITSTTNLFNNLFIGNNSGGHDCQWGGGGAIYLSWNGNMPNFYNNTFSNNPNEVICIYRGEIGNLYNNIFAFGGLPIRNNGGSISNLNYNAYWQNGTNCSGAPCGEKDVNFTAQPFLGDNSDRNFLIAPNQVNFIRDKGTNIGDDNFFNTKTIGVDNILDTAIRDIGYHYLPVQTTCNNIVKDSDETDVDCGGPTCPRCEESKRCLVNEDCISNYCNPSKACDVQRDLYIEWIKPIQVVEGVPLVAGKATVVRVKVVNNGPETTTDVSVNYGNGCYTETKHNVLISAFSSKIVDFYPPNNCTHT